MIEIVKKISLNDVNLPDIEADKVAQAIDMPGITTTIVLYTDYYLTIKSTQNGEGSEKTVLANYTSSNLALKSEKMSTTVVGNMRLN